MKGFADTSSPPKAHRGSLRRTRATNRVPRSTCESSLLPARWPSWLCNDKRSLFSETVRPPELLRSWAVASARMGWRVSAPWAPGDEEQPSAIRITKMNTGMRGFSGFWFTIYLWRAERGRGLSNHTTHMCSGRSRPRGALGCA